MNPISAYFPDMQPDSLTLFDEYEKLLIEWNARINLISRKDIEFISERHILHSLSIVKYFSFEATTEIADIGSGGGFPGIPLAIACPHVRLSLIESIRKKSYVLTEIINSLGLTNVTVMNIRAEDVKRKYNFVTGRAVAAFPDFYATVKHLVSSKNTNSFANGILYLKGGDFGNEISGFRKAQLFSIHEVFPAPYFETKKLIYLPFSQL